MARDPLAARFDALITQVLVPLILGGKLEPVRPFGPHIALTIGAGRSLDDVDLRSRLNVARVRVARLIAPVDTLPTLGVADFALAAAFNDLLQLTNHELASPLTRNRYSRLLSSLYTLCEKITAPVTVGACLSRHATFARVLECVRTDTHVSWWTGKAGFRGQPPPTRLLRWRSLRNVDVRAKQVSLAEMIQGLPFVPPQSYRDALTLWLTRTPLTDIATAARRSPPFAWSRSTLSLIATPAGRTLAHRALLWYGSDRAANTLLVATHDIPDKFADAKIVAEAFTNEVRQRLEATT